MQKYSNFRAPSFQNTTMRYLKNPIFLGVDYTDPEPNVTSSRGIDSLNYIMFHGRVRKRWGYRQIGVVPVTKYYPLMAPEGLLGSEPVLQTNPRDFNGIWNFTDSSGAIRTVAHIGKLLYSCEKQGDGSVSFKALTEKRTINSGDKTTTVVAAFPFENRRSMAFADKDSLLFLGGNAMAKVILRDGELVVANISCFVPTTMTGITCAYATASSRHGLDWPNALTKLRKNTLISGIGTEGSLYRDYRFTLDAPIYSKDPSDYSLIEGCIKRARPKIGVSSYPVKSKTSASIKPIMDSTIMSIAISVTARDASGNELSGDFPIEMGTPITEESIAGVGGSVTVTVDFIAAPISLGEQPSSVGKSEIGLDDFYALSKTDPNYTCSLLPVENAHETNDFSAMPNSTPERPGCYLIQVGYKYKIADNNVKEATTMTDSNITLVSMSSEKESGADFVAVQAYEDCYWGGGKIPKGSYILTKKGRTRYTWNYQSETFKMINDYAKTGISRWTDDGSHGGPHEVFGYIENAGEKESNGIVHLFGDWPGEYEGQSNVWIEFPSEDDELSSFVTRCTIGCLFDNRLFLSGNPDKPEYDCHSEEPDFANDPRGNQGDLANTFSYFPAAKTQQKYGLSKNPVIGYAAVSPTKLLVLKKKMGNAPTVYFRNKIETTAYGSDSNALVDASGNVMTEYVYNCEESQSATAGVNPFSVVNFSGDTIFIDDNNHAAGLDIQGITGDSQRIANSRSYYIDAQIEPLDLSNAILYSAGDYLFLSTEKRLYAAFRGSRTEAGQYEWWPLDSIHATCIASLGEDGTVYFGNPNGFFKMKMGDFYDGRRFEEGATYAEGTEMTISNESLSEINSLRESGYREVYGTLPEPVMKGGMMGEIMSLSGSGPYGVTTNYALNQLSEDLTYYIANVRDGFPCHIKWVEDDTEFGDAALAHFTLVDDDGNAIASVSDGAVLARPLDGSRKMLVTETGLSFLKPAEENDVEKLVAYQPDGEQTAFTQPINLEARKPIFSYFVASPMFNDSYQYMHTIKKIDLINNSQEPVEVSVALLTNRTEEKGNTAVVNRGFYQDSHKIVFSDNSYGFDLMKLNLEQTDFDKNSIPRSYSVRRFFSKQRNCSLVFTSENAKNSILPGYTVTYILKGLARGSE